MPALRLKTTPSSIKTRYWSFKGRRWKAATAASRILATLRVDKPNTKQARIMRSMWAARRA